MANPLINEIIKSGSQFFPRERVAAFLSTIGDWAPNDGTSTFFQISSTNGVLTLECGVICPPFVVDITDSGKEQRVTTLSIAMLSNMRYVDGQDSTELVLYAAGNPALVYVASTPAKRPQLKSFAQEIMTRFRQGMLR